MILGSGRLLDVPLATLASEFRRVVLVDALHPPAVRLRVRRHANVELWSEDITGTAAALHRLKSGDPLPPARSFAPLHDPRVDLVVSLNLLSQLGVLTGEWIEHCLRHSSTAAEAFAADLVRTHLDDLARCRATVCLVGDVEWRHVGRAGELLESQSSIFGVSPPVADEEWLWPIAPAPESDPVVSDVRRVIVAYDPGKRMPRADSDEL